MTTYKIAQLLKNEYSPRNVNLSLNDEKNNFLSHSIIPSDVFVYSGLGATLQTNKGTLIDLSSMTVNCILGQNDPWVNANLMAYLQSGRPSFLTTRLGSDFYYKVAKKIIECSKMQDGVINHRQCNGTDVTELAILAAYKHRQEGQYKIASFNNSYHGQGLTAYLMSGLQQKNRFLIDESPILFLDQPSHVDLSIKNNILSTNDQSILNTLKKNKHDIFAVIIEPIQVNNGVNTPNPLFIKMLKDVCVDADISLIFDEVQTGFGWLGTMTGAEKYNVWPNLMALSKAITSGNGPLSVLVSDKKYQDIPEGTGAKTNGADIRSLVASSAVIDRLQGLPASKIPQGIPEKLAGELKSGLLSNFEEKNKMLEYYLQDLKNFSHDFIKTIKGYGLIRGIEITDVRGAPDIEATKKIQLELVYSGVLVRHHKHTLIFKPPLVITEKEMEKGFQKIKKIFKKYIK